VQLFENKLLSNWFPSFDEVTPKGRLFLRSGKQNGIFKCPIGGFDPSLLKTDVEKRTVIR
jgi:hypothetical protein